MKSTTFLAIGLSALLQLSAAQGTTTSPAASTDTAKVQSCYDTYKSCRIAAGQNLNPCQTALQTCLGYNPFDSPPAPAATSDAGRVQACYDQYKPCRIADNADQNVCAAQLKQCLGYNPFGDSTATSPAPSTTAAPPAATHDAARQQACYDKYKQCRIAANADLSACGSQLNACLGYNAFGSTSAAVTPATTVPGATSKTATASPTKYTGAAAKIQVEDVLFLAALGLAAV